MSARPVAGEARDTRREILDTALELFAEHGFHATSVRAIARAVGVRESALYHHFSSKEAILEAVVDDRVQARLAVLQDHLEALERPLSELLTRFAEQILQQLESPKERRFMRLAMSLGVPLLDEHSPFKRIVEARARVTAVLDLLKRRGRIRADLDPDVFMLHFAAPLLVASGVLFPGGRSPVRAPLKQFIRDHVAFILRAVAPEAGDGAAG